MVVNLPQFEIYFSSYKSHKSYLEGLSVIYFKICGALPLSPVYQADRVRVELSIYVWQVVF